MPTLNDHPVQGGPSLPVYLVGGNGNSNPAAALPVSESWRVSLVALEANDDSDKEYAVPTGYEAQILWIWVELTTTSTAGDRQLVVEILDNAADVIAQAAVTGKVQTASLTRKYLFAPACADLSDFRDTDFLSTPLPPTLFLSAGQSVRVYDNNAIAAAADDMIVQMQIASRVV